MPHKSNPIRSVLIRRAALTAGPLGATLHIAAAASVDERADGAWHAAWATLRTLARRTVVAASHTSELLSGLRVGAERAAANLAAAEGLLSEQQTMIELTGRTATPEIAAEAHHFLRSQLSARFGDDAGQACRILYGGSVKPDNIKGLMAQPDLDGALVGGASLDPASFAAIVNF